MKALIITAIIIVASIMYFVRANPTCKEAKRLRDTPTTYERWVKWDEKYQCEELNR